MATLKAALGPELPAVAGYDTDFALWAVEQAAAARAGRLAALDLDNIAEELEGLMKSDRRALASHLRELILHLLKWQFQPERRGASWQTSINNAWIEIDELFVDSPSFSRLFPGLIEKHYRTARREASVQTGLPKKVFPDTCPYRAEQLLDEDYLPD